ncbi:MAG: uracil phosphoribosyltransferase [Bacteroidales bacterium]|jgi:uracil phosphoribosyltransferase|nr:uracil phosphoribosyltransferase [Bacteroidales bacterium]
MNNLHILGNHNSLFNEFISEVRSVEQQNDSMRFRRNMERIGEIFAYEISKTMQYADQEVVTPLGIATVPRLVEKPVLATILRAGLPMHQGMLNYFDHADNAFISAFRKYYKDGTFEIQIDYLSAPDLDEKTLILCDSMLATGQSLVLAYEELMSKGDPMHTHIVSAIVSRQGLDYVMSKLPDDSCTYWIGAIDEELTAQSFIVPGLGDAGDLAYGIKE